MSKQPLRFKYTCDNKRLQFISQTKYLIFSTHTKWILLKPGNFKFRPMTVELFVSDFDVSNFNDTKLKMYINEGKIKFIQTYYQMNTFGSCDVKFHLGGDQNITLIHIEKIEN